MELNKIVGAFCATLLVLLSLNFFSEMIFENHDSHGEAELAFALEIEEADTEVVEETIDLAALFASVDLAEGEKVYRKCRNCHLIEDGENKTGPHLWNLVNRQIAAVDGFNYSGALPGDEAWTTENLFAFLEAPKKWAPGTSMGFAGLRKPEDRANVIAYINSQAGDPEQLD